MKIVAVVLVYNEERHISRCIESLKRVVDTIVVVDCYSCDSTAHIATNLGASVIQNEWTNHAEQFNWALKQLPTDSEWVLRIDADEYLTNELASEIASRLPAIHSDVNGVYIPRRMTFQGKLIRHGGVFPVKILRLFRYGRGVCENRWMDEHIKVSGVTVEFEGELIDDNLNSLSWWTDKHNKYSSREAVEMLNLQYGFLSDDSGGVASVGGQPAFKRWLKENIYACLPTGFRAFSYFFYRYIIRLGFLDGQAGTAFHFLQGFWYRYLVDAKVLEVKRYMRQRQVDVAEAIEKVLGIKV